MKQLSKITGIIMALVISLVAFSSLPGSNAKADQNVDPNIGFRYEQPTAKYYIRKGTPQSYRIIINQAITNWNNTHAFTWVRSKTKVPTTIGVTNSNQGFWKGNHYAGVTLNLTKTKNVNDHTFQTGAKITLNPRVMANMRYTYNQQLLTVEHELGHAMGLKHNHERDSIMYPNDTYYNSLNPNQIGPSDISGVQTLYNEK